MATSDNAPQERARADAAGSESTPHELKAGAIGLVGVLFMAVANAAPITAMTGNTPDRDRLRQRHRRAGRLPGRDRSC